MTNKKSERGKEGVSPVIATILLIGVVVVIGLIIFAWLSSLTEESVTKFEKNAALVCEEVDFEASYSQSSGKLFISNIGNIPIYEIMIKITEEGGFRTENIRDLVSGWPEIGLNQGKGFSESIDFAPATNIELIPVILGSASSGGQKTFTCDERFSKEVSL